MRLLPLLSALVLSGLAGPALSQTTPARPRVAVVVVTLDEIRQLQARYGRGTLDLLGDVDWGRFEFTESALGPERFASCQNERSGRRLDYCIRFYLTRADAPADAPPTVVVAFNDQDRQVRTRGPDEMQVVCFGRGVVPTDASAQTNWLWPTAARLHGSVDLERDRDALAACIEAAASEPWTGLRQPDVD
jgi:hypothetical protein